jgi:hypothetical protein
MEDFNEQPLTDIWEVYSESLNKAISANLFREEDLSDDYVWPHDLLIDDWEREDVKRYVTERMSEIVDRLEVKKALEPNLIAAYLFRSVIAGMLWEKNRIG